MTAYEAQEKTRESERQLAIAKLEESLERLRKDSASTEIETLAAEGLDAIRRMRDLRQKS